MRNNKFTIKIILEIGANAENAVAELKKSFRQSAYEIVPPTEKHGGTIIVAVDDKDLAAIRKSENTASSTAKNNNVTLLHKAFAETIHKKAKISGVKKVGVRIPRINHDL